MSTEIWLARDADEQRNLYSLLTGPPVLQQDGLVTTADETDECLGAYSAEQAEQILGIVLGPGECVRGQLQFTPQEPARAIPPRGQRRGEPSSDASLT